MEIDHFNPTRRYDRVQSYHNLFLSTRHCNGAKRDRWPSAKMRKLGIRFLNCCQETDYGVHIFEDPDTHELVGVTPEGRYHIRNCDLNAPHLLEERTERWRFWTLLERKLVRFKKGWAIPDEIQALKSVAEKMIPRITMLSGKALEEYRAKRRAMAAVGNHA
jgi:hypothetical protein